MSSPNKNWLKSSTYSHASKKPASVQSNKTGGFLSKQKTNFANQKCNNLISVNFKKIDLEQNKCTAEFLWVKVNRKNKKEEIPFYGNFYKIYVHGHTNEQKKSQNFMQNRFKFFHIQNFYFISRNRYKYSSLFHFNDDLLETNPN